MLHLWILIMLMCTDGSQQIQELPDFVKPCANDPNLTRCTSQILEDLRTCMVQGIKEFHLPPIDPLHIPFMMINRRGSHISDYTANLTDMIWTGCKNFEVLETLIDPDSLVFRLKLAFPFLHMNALADADGSILQFQMKGAGELSFNATNVILDIVLNGEQYKHKDLDFITWKKEDIGVTYEDFYFVDITGLFEDATLSHLFKLALNNGIRILGTSARLALGNAIGNFIIEAVNRVHSLYPINVLYPNSKNKTIP